MHFEATVAGMDPHMSLPLLATLLEPSPILKLFAISM
jgi:hypothetical protein